MPEDNSHAGKGAVMLDIGGDIGALIVEMPAEMEGIEVEIRPVGTVVEASEHSHDDHAHDDHAHDDHAHDDHADGHDDGHAHDDHGHDHDHGHGHLIHVAVVGRPANDGIHYSLVYPELTTGTYELYERPAGPVKLTASVVGGEVTNEVWPV